MYEKLLSDFFESEKIKYYASLPVGECPLLYPRKLPDFTVSVCFFLIPYLVRDTRERNVSLYAVSRDYHFYIRELSERLETVLSDTELSFKMFSDNSPFNERTCASISGLGKKGKSGLLINPEYGSFTFIGCICLSDNISITQNAENFKCDLCENCEKCVKSCPYLLGRCSACLSHLTQKKSIDTDEAKIISGARLKWGCDICQEVCPYNRGAAETPIEFFKQERIPCLTSELVSEMSDDEFQKRAYAWRGKSVILRNLDL